MHHIHAENKRYAKAAVLHGDTLVFADFATAFHVEHASYPSGGYVGSDVGVHDIACNDVGAYGQIHLSDFLVEGHPGQQAVDKLPAGVIGSRERQRQAQSYCCCCFAQFHFGM